MSFNLLKEAVESAVAELLKGPLTELKWDESKEYHWNLLVFGFVRQESSIVLGSESTKIINGIKDLCLKYAMILKMKKRALPHMGSYKYHDDDCWCCMGGGFCNRDGYVWSCCGAFTKKSSCAGRGNEHHEYNGTGRVNGPCACHECLG